MRDLHELPKFGDGMSYLYVEHCKIERELNAIAIFSKEGKIPIPCAGLALLMIGPGSSITHEAIKVLADDGCLVSWCGEEGIRFYSSGFGKTRSARNILKQAYLAMNPTFRLEVVKKMYVMRFNEELNPHLTIQQLRGKEGARVRAAYAKFSSETGVEWKGRNYKRENWNKSDPINRAISSANSCLYGLCTSAIITAGYSPAIGFVHTGKQLSFTYDIADLYKTEITIPIAFQIVKDSVKKVSSRTRHACRDKFKELKLLERIIPDINTVLTIQESTVDDYLKDFLVDDDRYLSDGALPGPLWDPKTGGIKGGENYGK